MPYIIIFLLFVSLPSFSKDIFLGEGEAKIYSVTQDSVIHIGEQDYDRLIVVENQDLDTFGSITLNDKDIHSASWMGPYGNYLILIPGNATDAHIQVKPLESSAVSTTVKLSLLSLQGKSANFMKGLENYTVANDLRIKKYLGHANRTAPPIAHFSAAEQYFEQDRATFYLGLALYEKGIALKETGARQEAVDALKKSIEIWSEHHPIQALRALNPLGLTYWHMGQLQEALSQFEEIMNTYTDELNSLVLAQAVNNAGLINWELGELTEAKKLFYQSLEINGVRLNAAFLTTQNIITAINQGDDRKNTAATLNNLALIYDGLGDPETAEIIWLAYIQLSENLSGRLTPAKAKNNLAMHYLKKGDYEHAQELLESACPIFEQNGNNRWLSLCRHNLGVFYDNLGMLKLAEIYFKKALALRDPKNHPVGHMASLHKLATIYGKQNKHTTALRLSQELLALAETHDHARFKALSHLNQYSLYRQQDNLQKAGSHIEPAVRYSQNSPHKRLAASIQITRAEWLMDNGNYVQAIEILSREIKSLKKIWHTGLLSRANNLLAQAYYLTQDFTESERVINEEITNLRFYLGSSEDAKINDSVQRMLKETRSLNALILHKLGKSQQAFLETMHQRSQFQSATRHRQEDTSSLHSEQMTAWLQAIQDKSEALENRQLSSADKERIENDIIELKARIDFSYQHMPPADKPPIQLHDIQKQLSDDVLLLVYAVGDVGGLSWWISHDQFVTHPLPPKLQLKERIALSRLELTGQSREHHHTKQLASILTGPLSEFKAVKTIQLITDEPLNLLPLGSLPDARYKQTQPIVASSAVQRINTPDAVTRSPYRIPKQVRALVVTDPVYSPQDKRLTHPPGETEAINAYPRLIHTQHETEFIAHQFNATTLSGFAANKRHFLSLDLQPFRVLHMASHAFFHPDIPGLSSLALSAYTPQGQTQPSAYVRAMDIAALPNNLDLTVLSGCETGLGQADDALGLSGLTESFLEAGSKHVVASLWQVDDQASSRFMAYFYQFLGDQQAVDQAFWSAQKAMLKNPRTRHPKYWAGWFLIKQ